MARPHIAAHPSWRGLICALLLLPACQDAADRSTGSRAQGMGTGGGDLGPVLPDLGKVPRSAVAPPVVTFLGEIGHADLRSPTRIAATPEGDLLVTDPRGRAAHLFTARGAYKFRLQRLVRPLGCAVDGQGNLYVGDQGTGSVEIFDALGNHQGQLGQGHGEFRMPTDLAVDPANEVVYVVDSKAAKVGAYATTGRLLFSFGGPGTGKGQLAFPTGIALDTAGGNVLVVSHQQAKVQVFTRAGVHVGSFGSFGGGNGQLTRPQGIALDAQERVYIADAFQGRVMVLDRKGQFVSTLGRPGTGSGQMALPSDVVLDRFGRLLVTSYDTGRVLIYGTEGHTDPPREVTPATVLFQPQHLSTATPLSYLAAHIELPDGNAAEIRPHTVRLRVGKALLEPAPGSTPRLMDFDGDKVQDLRVLFGMREVIAGLGKAGVYRVQLAGELSAGDVFKGSAQLTLRADKGGTP